MRPCHMRVQEPSQLEPPPLRPRRDDRLHCGRVLGLLRVPSSTLLCSLALVVACSAEKSAERPSPPGPRPAAGEFAAQTDAAPTARAPREALAPPRTGEQVVLRTDTGRVRATKLGPPLDPSSGIYSRTSPLVVVAVESDAIRVVVDAEDIRLWLWVDSTAVAPMVVQSTEVSLDPARASWNVTGIWVTRATPVRVVEFGVPAGWARIAVPLIEDGWASQLAFVGFVPSHLVVRSFVEGTLGARAPEPGPPWLDATPTASIRRRSEILETPGGRVLATVGATMDTDHSVPMFEEKDGYVLTSIRRDGVSTVGWIAAKALVQGRPHGSGYGAAGSPRPRAVVAGACVFDTMGDPVGLVARDTLLPLDADGGFGLATPWGYAKVRLRRGTDGWEGCASPPP